ncbi:MAG: DUF3102 domain-containing protein [Treponema sp.]|jgi:hypothetical protein|nr:DUF3102 domain-containing protein [Treponema sp.]
MNKPEPFEAPPDFSFSRELRGKARAYAEEAGLIPREEAPPPAPAPVPVEIFLDKAEEVNTLYKKFLFTMKKGAAFTFEIGKILKEVWEQLDVYTSWPQWCRERLVLSLSTANRCLRIYENFKDNPKVLAGLTTGGVIKTLSAPPREPREAAEYGAADRQMELPWERYFELPPLSGEVKLNNYRFEAPNDYEVYVIRRGINYPVKVVDILAPEDKRLKTARRGMLEEVQAALERYYQEIERIETLEANT